MNRMVRKSITEKMAFEHRFEGGKREVLFPYLWKC